MENLIDRIYKIIDYKSISVYEFSKRIHVSNGYLSKQRTNNANIGSHIIEKIVREFPDINPIWLLMGSGNMIRENINQGANVVSGIDKMADNNHIDFNKSSVMVQRIVDILDKDRFTDRYRDIAFHCQMIHEFTNHYSLHSKSQKLEKDNNMKELSVKIQEIIITEKELLNELYQYSDILKEIYNKLSDFDEKHDRAFCLDSGIS